MYNLNDYTITYWDSGYRGELGVIIDNIGTEPINITKGFKIAQILIAPTPMMEFTVVDKLADSDRGEGGYGSTDKSWLNGSFKIWRYSKRNSTRGMDSTV